jgi:anti-sigma factor ChrR (cupin superfamily)
MASMAMAQAALEHAHSDNDSGDWHLLAECSDTWSVLEALDRQATETQVPFGLEMAAIANFVSLVARRATTP